MEGGVGERELLPVPRVEAVEVSPRFDFLRITLFERSYVVLDHDELEQTQLRFLLDLQLELVLHLSHDLLVGVVLVPLIQPWVSEQLVDGDSLVRILDQHLSEEIGKILTIRIVDRKRELLLHGIVASLLNRVVRVLVHKGVLEVGETVDADAQRPDVRRSALDGELLFDDLRGVEHEGALDILQRVLIELADHPEVAHLGVVALVEQDVLRLDVSVHQLVHENGLEALQKISRYFPELLLGQLAPLLPKLEYALLLDPLDQLPVLAVLHDDVEELLLVVADHLFYGDDVFVVHALHGFDLIPDLVVHYGVALYLRSLLAELLLRWLFPFHNFDCELLVDAILLFLNHEHIPVRAFSELVAEHVVVQQHVSFHVLALDALHEHRHSG